MPGMQRLTIIAAGGRKTLSVALEQMGLLDLAGVGEASVLDAKVVGRVVLIDRNLAPLSGDEREIGEQLLGGRGADEGQDECRLEDGHGGQCDGWREE